MKKYVLKATALAIGALVGGAAFASVDFSGTKTVTANEYASELDYSKATGAEIAAGETIVAKLGFGVSANQNRYIRIDLGGATLAEAGGEVAVTTGNALAGATVVAGGGANDSFIIFQITGNTAAAPNGNTSSDIVTVTLPKLWVTGGNSTSPTATYALYETAVAAVAAAPNTQLATPKTGALFSFASGLKFDITAGVNTASVDESFKKFTADSASPTKAAIGKFDYGTVADVWSNLGTQVTLAQLVQAGTKVKIAGDFTAASATAKVYLAATSACAAPIAGSDDDLATDKLSYTAPVDATDTAAYLCYEVSGSKVLNAQDITATLVPVAKSGVTLGAQSAKVLGSIKRDGATLQAPFVTTHPDYLSRVILNSTAPADAGVELSVITKDGVTCSNSVYKTTLPAGKQIMVNVKDICGDLTAGTSFFAVQAVVAAKASQVQGAYNAVQYDATTGKPGAYMSYPLVAPVK